MLGQVELDWSAFSASMMGLVADGDVVPMWGHFETRPPGMGTIVAVEAGVDELGQPHLWIVGQRPG